ncbi:MAG: NAD(P)-dependent alcohol dehydrogenase [Actinobacteria bacterium]|nr:NAD(P)-dependent alcohol dehydrogenase [Actinomycetota bacterium]
MRDVAAYATAGAREPFARTSIPRRDVGPHDVLIRIEYAGICHSDIHTAREEWGTAIFPLVPGHEIAGVVEEVGSEVSKLAVGDRAGVGCMVDSCGECRHCLAGNEQFCRTNVGTYNSRGYDGEPTYGGYSTHIVVKDAFALRIPDALSSDVAAPLLCAGITTYSPLRHWKVGPGSRVAVAGLGGLGHMGVKIAAALGAEVTVLTRTDAKAEDARRLGAHHVRATADGTAFKELRSGFDLILNTVSAELELDKYLRMLDVDGTMVNVGLPEHSLSINLMSVVGNRRSLSGSPIGGIAETQEMLDFCAEHGLGADVEVIDATSIDAAYDRVVRGDVRYRFVIDTATI